MNGKVWLLDCDNTLYDAGSGFFKRVDGRITRFMAEVLGIEGEKIRELRKRYRENFGVTLVGLMKEWAVDPQEYLVYVHDVELDDLVFPDAKLAGIIEELPGERHIFTNGSKAHAGRVLKRLGVESLVGEIFDIEFMGYVPKPKPEGYHKVIASLGVSPEDCVLVDDQAINLETAKNLGMQTILVGGLPVDGHGFVPDAYGLAGLF